MTIQCLKPVFDVNSISKIIEEISEYPTFTHIYGEPQPPRKPDVWMSYGRADGVEAFDRIEFLRGYNQIAPTEFQYIADYLNKDLFLSIDVARINFLRTRGSVGRHTDEVRTCSINIGVKNTAIAETSFDDKTITCQDGRAYILDVSTPHWVTSSSSEYRYMISYGFGIPFKVLQDHFAFRKLIDE